MVAAGEAYVAAVQLAGGFPMLLPPGDLPGHIEDALTRVDGVLFTGGKDVDPRRYGQTVLNARVVIEPGRDAFELPLAQLAVARNYPVLAICRGMQVLNVALGGTLWQDLPAQIPESEVHHYQKAPRSETTHDVDVTRDSLLGDLVCAGSGTRLPANSFHHQAARVMAPPLSAVAHAADGLVEAVEMPDRDFVVGVQWHPEHLVFDHEGHRRLFEGLVKAARKRRTALADPA
ncbi:MAG: Glutamine amidotransferase, class I [uncultured Chloroflexi bacterium]|uniref:Glutamine amidotransferase, class I n=1 Tax=uncultured Chloroflexota bacterium TaxID=166587 RepID=A0A6J4HM65_9CHLR|nr:MAG: Glutamine amidotransferase, class I [uncultured Chloroflexota bacterium]